MRNKPHIFYSKVYNNWICVYLFIGMGRTPKEAYESYKSMQDSSVKVSLTTPDRYRFNRARDNILLD